MIIDNKIYLLTEKYQISNDNMKILKIKLLILNDAQINLSYMFYKCDSLKKVNLISKDEASSKDNYEDKNYQIEDTNISNLSDSKNTLNKIFNETDTNNNSNNSNINKNIYDNTQEKMNSIINLSHDFLSSKYSTISFKNNNHSDNSLINENLYFIKLCKSKIFNYYVKRIFDEDLLISENKNIIPTI